MIPVGILTAASTSTFSYLLDLYPTATAAYSLRKLRAGYTGSCIQVRRSIDGALLDIGFVNNVLDTTTLLAFIGSFNGVITNWYDQSGNGNTAINVGLGSCLIVIAGVLQVQNGKPSISFTNSPLTLTSSINSNINTSVFIVGKSNTTTNGPLLGSAFSGPIAGQINGFYTYQGGNTTTLDFFQTSSGTGDTNFNVINYYYRSTSFIYENNTLITITNSGTFGATVTAFTLIGRYAAAFDTIGFISEIVLYKSDQLSNRTGINTNINTFYTIY